MTNVIASIKKYIQESKRELKKVTWPDRASLTKTFFQVLFVVILTALLLLLVDKILSWAVSLL